MLTREGFSVRVLMSGELHRRLERFRTVRTLVRAHVRMRQQMVVVHAVRFEPVRYEHNLITLCIFNIPHP